MNSFLDSIDWKPSKEKRVYPDGESYTMTLPLNKEQRMDFYKWCLQKLEFLLETAEYEEGYPSFCNFIWNEISYHMDIQDFPELMEHEPERENAYWFSCNEEGTKERIKILKQISEEPTPNPPDSTS